MKSRDHIKNLEFYDLSYLRYAKYSDLKCS